jgi:cell shape-determining protein MreC
MRPGRRRFDKTQLFAILMAASFVALFIPASFTSPLKNSLQLLAPIQWGLHSTASGAAETIREGVRSPVAPSRFDAVRSQRDALEHTVIAMDSELTQLRQSLAAVAGWRGRGLDPRIAVIPARVVAADSMASRDAIVIDRGTSDGVAVGDWVVSHGFVAPGVAGKQAAIDLLREECLLGQIVEATPLTSRLELLTDAFRRPPMRVRIARVEEDDLVGPVEDFALYGKGDGAMAIPDVPRQLHQAAKVRVGDLVISSPDEAGLPIAMVIGQIDRIEPDEKNPHLSHVFASPRIDTSTLRNVYVIHAGADEGRNGEPRP